MTKRIKLPREQSLLEPEQRARLIDSEDVEGHGLPTTAPPSFDNRRGTGHGGESPVTRPLDDDEDDVEGHKRH
jgi:hypothetical protein